MIYKNYRYNELAQKSKEVGIIFDVMVTGVTGAGKSTTLNTKLIDLLYKEYGENNGFIDLVLVVIEGSNRDMGTTYKLLNEIIVPNFQKKRIFVAINQADMAMKGRHWNYETHKPMPKLKAFLEEQALSIQRRVYEATGVKILKPVYYSAQYNYNINALLDFFIDNMPKKKRVLKLDAL